MRFCVVVLCCWGFFGEFFLFVCFSPPPNVLVLFSFPLSWLLEETQIKARGKTFSLPLCGSVPSIRSIPAPIPLCPVSSRRVALLQAHSGVLKEKHSRRRLQFTTEPALRGAVGRREGQPSAGREDLYKNTPTDRELCVQVEGERCGFQQDFTL